MMEDEEEGKFEDLSTNFNNNEEEALK